MLPNADVALEVLRARTGMKGLRFDPLGTARLGLGVVATIFATRISDGELEVVSRLDHLPTDEASLRRMLTANSLGDGVGAARLAIDPLTGKPILCRRFEVAQFDEDSLIDAFREFSLYAGYWRREGEAELARGDEALVAARRCAAENAELVRL